MATKKTIKSQNNTGQAIDQSGSGNKILNEIKNLLGSLNELQKKSAKSLEKIEKTSSESKKQKDQEKKQQPFATASARATGATVQRAVTPPLIGSSAESDKKDDVIRPNNWEIDESSIPEGRRTPRRGTQRIPSAVAPRAGVGLAGGIGAIAGATAVVGGLTYLGMQEESQLPATAQDAAAKGVNLSKDNQIFSKKPVGIAQVLDEQDRERKKKQIEAEQIGPTRATKEDYQASQNQAADYKAAGDTLSSAGFSTVTDRRLLNPGAKELSPVDFENAQQAQAAREAAQRGLRQRSRSQPPSASSTEPNIFSRIGSKIANVKNEISFAYNRGTGETPGEQELDAKMEDVIAAREKEGNPIERFSQEYNDIRNKIRKEIEAKNPQAFVQAEQKIGSQSQMRQSSSASSEGVTNETELNKSVTSSKSLFGSEFLGGLATKKGLTKEFSIGDTSLSTEKDGRVTNERSDVTARRISGGFFGRDKYKVTLDGEDVDVDKQYYSQIKGLLDAGKPKEAAAMARHIRDQSQDLVLRSPEETVTPMSQGASSLPVALSQLSAENRDLGREDTSAPVQPVIIQNNNNMASQSFVPMPAQPRTGSSYSRYQERSAVY